MAQRKVSIINSYAVQRWCKVCTEAPNAKLSPGNGWAAFYYIPEEQHAFLAGLRDLPLATYLNCS